MTRALLVIPSRILGGAERQTMQLARLWRRDFGAEVLVAAEPALLPALAPLAEGARLVAVRLAGDPAEDAAAERARQAAALRPLLLRHRPDAVLVELPLPTEGIGALLACAALGVPALGHAHLVRRDWTLGEGERAAAASLAGRAGFAAVSPPAARRLEGLFGLAFGAVAAVPNGLPNTRPTPVDRPARRAALGVPQGGRLALMLGSLDERKGAMLAPEIARRIAPDVLAMAGDGPLRAAIANDAPGNLVLLGPVPDPRAWLACADALLLPSMHEGCPLVLLEAAAERVPIIAARDAVEAWEEPWRAARLVRRNPAEIAAALREAPDPARVAAAALEAWDEAAMAERLAWLLAREVARLRPRRVPGLVGRGAALVFGRRRAALLAPAAGEAAWLDTPDAPRALRLALLRGAPPLAELVARPGSARLVLRAGAACEVAWAW